jgi:hypothetical protein
LRAGLPALRVGPEIFLEDELLLTYLGNYDIKIISPGRVRQSASEKLQYLIPHG